MVILLTFRSVDIKTVRRKRVHVVATCSVVEFC